ncbi:hypothetical protein HPB52_006007 [Rhipicephalus sanguineus]|uniref:Uncharacterized protein n=1 Tax=Rhipicephalus sanguineus TaxID=34632 RepID=A0A9D4SXT1_RHISA|nr:hypothetical protein HPB52_006007 [Rhipicephalus sanguineus]
MSHRDARLKKALTYAMGKTPLFCTVGVHKQNYKRISFDACDYAFIPFYVRGKDTFTDDSNAVTKDLINAASTSTRTSFAISVPNANRSTVLRDITSSTGKAKIKDYWTSKKIYHYAVFDIGVKEDETRHQKTIIGDAFNLLKYCKLRKAFADVPFGLTIFDLECEDWEGACNNMSTPIPGTKRYKNMTTYFAAVGNWTKSNYPC